jgi:hypothetical protein
MKMGERAIARGERRKGEERGKKKGEERGAVFFTRERGEKEKGKGVTGERGERERKERKERKRETF